MNKSPGLELSYFRGSKLPDKELCGPFTLNFNTPWKSGKFQKTADILSAFLRSNV